MDEKEKAQARIDAIEVGRLAGRLEAESRREEGEAAESRIKRAMAYAAWDFDGRQDDPGHASEFGIIANNVTPSLERAPLGDKVAKDDDSKSTKKKFRR